MAFFPDMAPQWDWMRERTMPGAEVLNLFGYTGVGSLMCAGAGAKVTHVDASRKSIGAAAENQKLSGMMGKPVSGKAFSTRSDSMAVVTLWSW